jgi:shikimate dehydrogenase
MVSMLLYHLKKPLYPFLDKLTIEAQSTQSVNTLYLKDNEVVGHNTDIIGFETSIKESKFNMLNKEV